MAHEILNLQVKPEDMAAFKDSGHTKTFKYKFFDTQGKEGGYGIQYSPTLFRKMLTTPEYLDQIVEWFTNPEAYMLKLPNGHSFFRETFLNMMKESCSGLMGLFMSKKAEKLENLSNLIDIKTLPQSVPNYVVDVSGKQMSIETQVLVDFLLEEHEQIDYGSDSTSVIHNMPKREFFYILKHFLSTYNVSQSFNLPTSTKKLIPIIQRDVKVDTYAFDHIEKTYDNVQEKININPKLREYVLNGMPENYSDTEKAVYIYVKLCKVLSYDPTFYAENENEKAYESHLDPKRLESISPENPNVVCFEINKLYALFLEELGLNYSISSKGGEYAKGHALLSFKSDEYVIEADSLRSIVGSDMLSAKIHEELRGLQCQNQNPESKEKFKQLLERVYSHIKENEPNEYLANDSFNKLKDMLFGLIKNPIQASFEDKIDVLGKMIHTSNLPQVEKNSLLLRRFKTIFPNTAIHELVIIAQKENESQEFFSNGILVSIAYTNPETYNQEHKYMIYKDDHFEEIEKTTLQQRMNAGLLQCHGGHFIPGMEKEREAGDE